ncbi:MAG: phospho-N-acetylmuramoyl-pentapeptide-transferase [Desulfarculaceae bacterium]|nr:phospho-N-acetylmuramoyl-pentapeptide-transferase [Desulfarculaceae bacterium]MCF8070904.1 phospho-N-acetylmuramoyl-pentapeptide-transferase [Desulfarculaceae bacterium]MCF8100492.1 phospho-N-acetylmuramoyl-pentapeptide-transferase [Desulfarculaceae bacterium]MCF8116518.1 phospho-N-acetylmuramoyl-pentapeptide-transferase [Desulfarculaceae bacterium]
MLYHLLYPLADLFGGFNVFRYITFRTIYAAVTALAIAWLMGPWMIHKLQELQVGQYIRELGPESHKAKAGTPTMGGVLILFAMGVSVLLWGDLGNFYLWLALGVTLCYGLIGFADDYLKKVSKANEGGLSARTKFLALALVALAAGVALYLHPGYSTKLSVPFFKFVLPDLGWGYVPLAMFILVGTANAVNLTDGLDGLAAGPVLIAAGAYLVLSYLTGNVKAATYLQIFYVPGAGELAVFCGAVAGAVMGFLWYNTYPAQIFMGDTGSLALGGALGITAVSTKHEILLVLVGGIFVVETISVILQVGFFKMTHGKRIFRMAPLHHHFELKGWAEPKVIVRFWIIAVLLALVAFSTLKLR